MYPVDLSYFNITGGSSTTSSTAKGGCVTTFTTMCRYETDHVAGEQCKEENKTHPFVDGLPRLYVAMNVECTEEVDEVIAPNPGSSGGGSGSGGGGFTGTPGAYVPTQPEDEEGDESDLETALEGGSDFLIIPIVTPGEEAPSISELANIYINLGDTPAIDFDTFIDWAQENTSAANEFIDFCSQYPNTDSDLLNDILDEWINHGDDTTVAEGPDVPVENMADYLSIFDTNSEATISISVEQPNPDKPTSPYSLAAGVGHAFVTIQQGTKVVSFGFYPETGVGYTAPTEGVMGNDENHPYDVSISLDVDGGTLSDIIDKAVAQADDAYDLSDSNCSDFVLDIAINDLNLDIDPADCDASWYAGSGTTPGKLGEALRNVILPEGATADYDGGISPDNVTE